MAILWRISKLTLGFNQLVDLIGEIRDQQRNYQKVTLCFLAKSLNHETTRSDLGHQLFIKNKNLDHLENFYTKSECPVYKVLKNKKAIIINGEIIKGNFKLTPDQVKEISKLCMEIL